MESGTPTIISKANYVQTGTYEPSTQHISSINKLSTSENFQSDEIFTNEQQIKEKGITT